MTTIFLDMDDTVADFSGAVNLILGYTPVSGDYTPTEWAAIIKHQRIYRDLGVCRDARSVVDLCRRFKIEKGYELVFLTAVPRNNDAPWAFTDKISWASKYFSDIPVWFGPFSRDKYKHCKPGDILIDDRKSNIDAWKDARGIAIHHTSVSTTVRLLSQLL